MSGTTIAVLGGYGAVGSSAVRRLLATAATEIRVGGRDGTAAQSLCARLGGPTTAHRVDLNDHDALTKFCSGADVVLNCAGPSYRMLDTVARVARTTGASYVDVAGDAPLLRLLRTSTPPDAPPAVVSAGVMPGLTGILPNLLLVNSEQNADCRLEMHVGGPVRMTPASAVDVLLATGPDFGTSLAAWRDGEVATGALTPRWHARVPGFDGMVHALPYLTAEVAEVARQRGVGEFRQYSIYVSERLPTTLATAWADSPDDPTVWAQALVDAADADLAEHRPSYSLVLRRFDRAGDDTPTAHLSLRTDDPYDLSGAVAALAVRALLDGHPDRGIHLARNVLDPLMTWSALCADPRFTTTAQRTSPSTGQCAR